jgi:hypothetical protein
MNNVRPLDEDSLGSLEEDTRSLVQLMKQQDPKVCLALIFVVSYSDRSSFFFHRKSCHVMEK